MRTREIAQTAVADKGLHWLSRINGSFLREWSDRLKEVVSLPVKDEQSFRLRERRDVPASRPLARRNGAERTAFTGASWPRTSRTRPRRGTREGSHAGAP